jgi:magnesium chelatase family protein
MEDGRVSISRAKGSVTYPAQFLLIAASNPCPCGYFGDTKRSCTCLPGMITRYQKRISGPILDRIDIHVDVPSVETQKLVDDKNENREKSSDIQKRVQKARNIQLKRFKERKINSNSEMGTRDVKSFCPINEASRVIMISAASTMNLTARSYFKIIKIARTIADLAGEKEISTTHIAEALQYRPKTEN